MKKLLPLFLFLLFIVSCVDKTPLTEQQQKYVGLWATVNSWVQIGQDGSGSFELPNANVSGGAATIHNDTITVSIFGIDADFKINKDPYELDGNTIMELDGLKYYKQ